MSKAMAMAEHARHYTREKLEKEPAGTVRYRMKRLPGGKLIRIAVHPGRKGPRGGVTTATSLLRPKHRSKAMMALLRRKRR